MNWIKPNTITGAAAEGAKYFRRSDIEDKIWNEINLGNHVLFLAPRRVGKSSIVMYMAESPLAGFSCKYEDIESDSSVQDFYKRLCKMTYSALSTIGKNKAWLSKWWNSWTISSVGKDKVDIGKAKLDYRDEFFKFLDDIKNQEEKVVLFLDEFPDVLWTIYKRHGQEEAEMLLTDIRTLKHTKHFSDVFVLVLLGSVGLSHIVKKITGRIDKVNQLHKEYLPPLKEAQSKVFLDFLLDEATMQVNTTVRSYLLTKIGHFIPYYIQLIIEECDELLQEDKRPELTETDIDKSYKILIKKHQFFEDWDSRLSKYFSDKYPYLLEILSNCAAQKKLALQEIYNIAVTHNNEQEWKSDIDDILIADGYITEDDGIFYFNSPLLRDWWASRHPIMKKA